MQPPPRKTPATKPPGVWRRLKPDDPAPLHGSLPVPVWGLAAHLPSRPLGPQPPPPRRPRRPHTPCLARGRSSASASEQCGPVILTPAGELNDLYVFLVSYLHLVP